MHWKGVRSHSGVNARTSVSSTELSAGWVSSNAEVLRHDERFLALLGVARQGAEANPHRSSWSSILTIGGASRAKPKPRQTSKLFPLLDGVFGGVDGDPTKTVGLPMSRAPSPPVRTALQQGRIQAIRRTVCGRGSSSRDWLQHGGRTPPPCQGEIFPFCAGGLAGPASVSVGSWGASGGQLVPSPMAARTLDWRRLNALVRMSL
jgi:hypothetical protein